MRPRPPGRQPAHRLLGGCCCRRSLGARRLVTLLSLLEVMTCGAAAAWGSEGVSEGRGPARRWQLELDVGGGVALRAFDYRNEQRGALRGYFLRDAPTGAVEVVFLYRFERLGAARGALGLRAAYDHLAPLDSHLADRVLATTAHSYRAEVIGRFRIGRFTLTPGAGYFARSYHVAGDVVPRVDHRSVGGSVDAALRLTGVLLELGAGFRWVLDAGQLQDAAWFPSLDGVTYSARFRVGRPLTRWLDLFFGINGEYTSFDFNIGSASAGYPNGVAAGAHDAYLTGLLSFRLHVPWWSGP